MQHYTGRVGIIVRSEARVQNLGTFGNNSTLYSGGTNVRDT